MQVVHYVNFSTFSGVQCRRMAVSSLDKRINAYSLTMSCHYRKDTILLLEGALA